MCMCLARGGVGGDGVIGQVWVVCVCNGQGDWTRVWQGGVVSCLCELSVRIICVDGRSRYLYIVLGHVFNPVAPYRYLFPTVYLFMADITNLVLFVCCCRNCIYLDITRQPSSASVWPACQKNGTLGPHYWGREVSTHFAQQLAKDRCDRSTTCMPCSLEPCSCLPTPTTLASGGSPMFPPVVHQPASTSIWPAVQSLRRGLSTNPGVTMWCVCGCS